MKINESCIKKILIIQIKPFGDVLLNTAYFPFLQKKFPKAKIDFLVNLPFHKVLENNPFINELIIFKKKRGFFYFLERINLFIRLYKKKYDLIIDQMRGTGSAQITLFSGAKYRLGFKNSRWSFVYNIKATELSQRYSASMKFDLLKPLGIKEQPYKLQFIIKPESKSYINDWLEKKGLRKEKVICISPGSPVLKKKWKLENYAALGDLILKNIDIKLILLWGPKEKNDVDLVYSLMKNKPIIALPTNFNQVAALLKKSELLICNDGGINHLSVATEIPSLAIFGNTNPINWAATNFKNHYYLYNKEFDSTKDNSFGISPKMAYEKVRSILGSN